MYHSYIAHRNDNTSDIYVRWCAHVG